MPDPTLGAYTRHEKHDAAILNTVANAVADWIVGPDEWIPVSVRYRVATKVLDALREKHDAPVRECPNPDQHTIATLPATVAAATPCTCSAQRARAEKAEKERDEARAELDLHALREKLTPAAEPRPLTPDDITEEMVERGWTAPSHGIRAVMSRATIRLILTAALTVPTRLDGAEAIEAALRDEWTFEDDDEFTDLADRLASRGVRVEGSGR